MYALVTDGSITKYLKGNRGITIGGINIQEIYTLNGQKRKEMP